MNKNRIASEGEQEKKAKKKKGVQKSVLLIDVTAGKHSTLIFANTKYSGLEHIFFVLHIVEDNLFLFFYACFFPSDSLAVAYFYLALPLPVTVHPVHEQKYNNNSNKVRQKEMD